MRKALQISKEVHHELKVYCAKNGKRIYEVVQDAIMKYLSDHG